MSIETQQRWKEKMKKSDKKSDKKRGGENEHHNYMTKPLFLSKSLTLCHMYVYTFVSKMHASVRCK